MKFSDYEVLQLAKDWVKKCSEEHDECPRKGSIDKWYPTRLLDLGEPNASNDRDSSNTVRLVLAKDLLKKGGRRDSFYVTLSHCWGLAKFKVLTADNLEDFQKGIEINSLSQTFQDAIAFARRLSKRVRFIWIDSLCIIQAQDNTDRVAFKDWLSESANMYKIYRSSYCNLSATAGGPPENGLLFPNGPLPLRQDDTDLIVGRIPGRRQLAWNWKDATKRKGNSGTQGIIQAIESVERCKIFDGAFWERQVETAPVNTRGWVLQERLMAPRVLHFCKGQIAWECHQMEAAESSITGLPIFQVPVAGGDFVPVRRLKSLVPHFDCGTSYLQKIIKRLLASPATSAMSMNNYHRWKQIVEAYSRTQLTNGSDKLIALSGIAKIMSERLNDTYLAGMWKQHLASQLLWRIDPVYADRKFYYPSSRPEKYRAPSFSWAAIDAQNGIQYGEITDTMAARNGNEKVTSDGLLIAVKKVGVMLVDKANPFGLVKSGVLRLSGLMKKIKMKAIKKDGVVRYAWNLVRGGVPSVLEHRNVCLDSPESDTDIFGPNGRAYCMPARRDIDKSLICLLFQLETKTKSGTGRFRRVGVTKIPSYEAGQNTVLELSGEETEIPFGSWDALKKHHTINIV